MPNVNWYDKLVFFTFIHLNIKFIYFQTTLIKFDKLTEVLTDFGASI